MIGLGCQIIEGELEEAKINAIGYTKNGRALLDSQEPIFTEALAEMETCLLYTSDAADEG